MIKDGYRYVRTVIDIQKMMKDFGNIFRVVSQRRYCGKPEKGIPAGVTFTVQVVEDHSEPIIDKKTGMEKDNNVFETFEVTVIGCDFPSAFKKGDYICFDEFCPEWSYYLDFSFILRFKKVSKVQPPQGGGGKA